MPVELHLDLARLEVGAHLSVLLSGQHVKNRDHGWMRFHVYFDLGSFLEANSFNSSTDDNELHTCMHR